MVNNRKFSKNAQRWNRISQREVESIEVKQLKVQNYSLVQIGKILGHSTNWVISRLRVKPDINEYNKVMSIMPTMESEAEQDRLMDILNGDGE